MEALPPDLSELLDEPPLPSEPTPISQLEVSLGDQIDRAYAAGARRTRSGEVVGSTLAQRLAPGSRRRYRTVVFLERQLQGGAELDLDHGGLILSMCQILESELTQKIVAPSRPMVDQLLDAIDPGERPREVIEAWAAGSVPVSLGVAHVVLFGLRRAVARHPERAATLLAPRFDGAYVNLLASKGFERAVGEIRNVFRNPIAHGVKEADADDYTTFMRWCLGAQGVVTWDQRGPSAVSAETAVLHHHLQHWRAAAQDAGEATHS